MDSADRPVDIEVLLEHRSFVRRLARRLVRDDTAVDDLEQETWVAALRNPPRDSTPLRAWLATVVRNLVWTRRRGESRRRRRERAAARSAAAPGPPELLERAAWSQRVVDAVMRLDEPYRTTLLLRYFEGLTGGEIARLQGVPAATVRTRVRRGIERLRADLDRRTEGGRSAWVVALLPLAKGPPRVAPPPPAPLPAALRAARLPLAAAGIAAGTVALLVAGAPWADDVPTPRGGRANPPAPVAAARPPAADRAGPAVPPTAVPARGLEVVVLADGGPVPGADVVLARRDPHPWRWSAWERWHPGPRGRTGGDGRAEFADLDPGYWGVAVAAAGRARGWSVAHLPREFGQPVVVELASERPFSIRVVSTHDPRPVAGAGATVLEAWGAPALVPLPPARAGPDGIVRVRGLGAADPARVVVDASGHVHSAPLPVPADDRLEVALVPRGRRLAWTVEGGPEPAPPAGTRLALRRPEGEAAGHAFGTATFDGTRIVARGLPRGVLPALLAVVPDGRFARLRAAPGAEVGEPTAFRRPRRLAVQVTGEDGEPVAGAHVTVRDGHTRTDLPPGTRTDATGRARLAIRAEEPVEVLVRPPEWEHPRAVGRYDPARGDARLDAVIPRSRVVELLVVAPDGPGWPGPRELLLDRERVPPDGVVAGGPGRIRLRARPTRPADSVDLHLLVRGYRAERLRVDLTDGRPLHARIDLRPAGLLVVPLLLRTPGQPVHLVLEEVGPAGAVGPPARRGPWAFRLYPGPDRVVREAMVPPGTYRVRDRVGGAATPPIAVRAGERIEAPLFDLSRAAPREPAEPVRGWIEAYADLDLSRARVEVRSRGGELLARGDVAADGSFTVPTPPDPDHAPWEVRAVHPDVARPARATMGAPREDLVLSLTPWHRAFLRLVPAPGPAPRGATRPRVLVVRPDGARVALDATLHGDELHFAGHRAGLATLVVDLPGLAPATRGPLLLRAGTTDLGTLATDPGTTLRLGIAVGEGTVPPSLTIAAQALGEPRVQRSVRTEGAERAAVAGLGAGAWRVTAWESYSGRTVWSRRIEVDGSNDRTVVVDLR